MNIAIMQPYFFPYIGYWQLINSVDIFVIYDNIKYTKKGWINRNRILLSGNHRLITLPIKNDSDFLDIRERYLSENIKTEKKKLLNTIKNSYYRAPQFDHVYSLIEEIILFENSNLFDFLLNSINMIMNYLDIGTKVIVSSSLPIDKSLRNKYRVMETCRILGANRYINPIGGIELYNKKEFFQNGLSLNFLKTKEIYYKQYDQEFQANLSIIDVLMFNPLIKVKDLLQDYELV